jgi:nicotinamidase-related amidase
MLRLPIRQYRCHPLPGQEYDERNFGHVHRELELDPTATALVTVDLWNMNSEPEPLVPELGREAEIGFIGLGRTGSEEAGRRIRENVAPVVEAARAAGLTVVHCNSEKVVRRYPECLVENPPRVGPDVPDGQCAGDRRTHAGDLAPEPWPPAEVRTAVLDEYVLVTWGEGAQERWDAMREVCDFPAAVRPVPGDVCVYQQEAFDSIMRERRITNIVYVGFLLGHCLMDKPGGLRSTAAIWNSPGYRTAVLRDCTLAQESAESIDSFGTTEAFIFWLEASTIPTATAWDFIKATENVR